MTLIILNVIVNVGIISHQVLFIIQGVDAKDKKPKQNTSGIGM